MTKSWTLSLVLVACVTVGAYVTHDNRAAAQVNPPPAQPAYVGPIPGRYQISAYGYGYGSGGGRDGIAGEGAYVLDTATGEAWRMTGNTVTYLGTPANPRRDTRVIATR